MYVAQLHNVFSILNVKGSKKLETLSVHQNDTSLDKPGNVCSLTVSPQQFMNPTIKLGIITVSWFMTQFQDTQFYSPHKRYSLRGVMLSPLFLRTRQIVGICLNSKGSAANRLLIRSAPITGKHSISPLRFRDSNSKMFLHGLWF